MLRLKISHARCRPLSCSIVEKTSPVALAKGIKNELELQGMRAAHVRDGAAMVVALSQLERDVAAGQTITEVDVDKRVSASRAKQDKFKGERFRAAMPTVQSLPRLWTAGSPVFVNVTLLKRFSVFYIRLLPEGAACCLISASGPVAYAMPLSGCNFHVHSQTTRRQHDEGHTKE